MSRLIDADTLFAEFENVGWYNNADRDEIAEPLILQAPTIDAVNVVRCKDCKYASDNKAYGCMLNHFNDNDYDYHRMYADDFCSRGERKE